MIYSDDYEDEEETDSKNENSKTKKNDKKLSKTSGGTQIINTFKCPYCGMNFTFRTSIDEKNPKPTCSHCHNKIKGLVQL